ncbi:MAG TPA: class I SAM-dependent methyltransferase [Puia sp.]|jgi:SAM-dependent methyltransferase|nr:class I SAM-dependent methyltransferase [Puia sp.]
MEKYIHDSYTHSLDSPAEIVGILYQAFKPASVIDIGCGTGTFLHQFKKEGAGKVLGIDGSWVNRTLLHQNLEENEFREMNLEGPISIGEKFDLAVCVEVAEHLDAAFADPLIESLTKLSDIIVFSAAIPSQDGQNHVNEQWIGYWATKFNRHGYITCDVIRPLIWNNPKVQWWYKQNMFLAYKESAGFDPAVLGSASISDGINNYIHPDNYLHKTKRLEDIMQGRHPLSFYLKQVIKKLIRPVRSPEKGK